MIVASRLVHLPSLSAPGRSQNRKGGICSFARKICGFQRSPLFSDDMRNYFWDYSNEGLQRALLWCFDRWN